MLNHHGSLLEKGYWEDVEQDREISYGIRAKGWILNLVKPSFTGTPVFRTQKTKRTAYLDGLRGFAALLVYFGHHQLWAHDNMSPDRILENAWGYDGQYYFACLPGIRTFFSGGHFAVTVFFVLSGYVLSTKPLTMIHAGEVTRLGDNLSSALFRRWLRLHIPVICTTFLYMASWHAIGYRADPEPKSTFREDLWTWYSEFKNFSFVFRTGGEPWFSYNFHTWSIPVEFRGSILIYTTLAAFSRCTRNARLWCEVGLIVYFMYIVDGLFCADFATGMLLCDLDLLEQSNNLPHFLTAMSRYKTILFNALFITGMYLGGVPSYSSDITILNESPGWSLLSILKPQAAFDFKWFYLFWAATFLVASIPRISWLRSFFETNFNQYLGRISFAFYLVHGPLLRSLGDRVYAAVGWVKESHASNIPAWINLLPLPKTGPFGLELSFWLPQLILLPITIWVADITTSLIDEPSYIFTTPDFLPSSVKVFLWQLYTPRDNFRTMLVKGIRRLTLILVPVLLVVSIVLITYTKFRITLPLYGSKRTVDSIGGRSGEGWSEELQGALSDTIHHEEDSVLQTHNEVFSVSTTDKRYFPIDFRNEKGMNPSIVPHPRLKDTWIVVAQRRPDNDGSTALFSEIACNARFEDGRLVCIQAPETLPVAATSGDKCVGDLAYFALNVGPHDARVFYGPRSPYIIFGSNSVYTCFGQWIQDFRPLVEWTEVKAIGPFEKYRVATELRRPTPYGAIEKNWFVFWDKEGQVYVHHDIYPKRVFARLELDGSTSQDLAPFAGEQDEKCMARYMPNVAKELESVHQATNSLSITFCRRSDLSCKPDDSNTFIFTIFQHKSYYSFHSVYEPYVMVFKRTAPFEIYAISSKPIWIHGRGRAGEAPRPKGPEFEGLEDWNQTEMFYVTSMSWKTHGQRYHGYIDDVVFIGFGIEDERSAGIDVVAGDLLRDLGLCSSL
ncbi:hypothetical protein H2200_004111 [Cladophialophora chaetospira]|uniref:Acyltransferase 3 domain-containing protein n=1 Tax=Cladophialophora chaetospira TaxID=386627 RepID=A0AA39CKL0_9EURO|nr:hypothetical protein H2200_004111 [Cladophialophora chaetospira]